MDLRLVSGLVLLLFGLMTAFGREIRPFGAVLALSLSGVALAALSPDWWWVVALLTAAIWFIGAFIFAVTANEIVPLNEYLPCPELFVPIWPAWICLVSLGNFVSQFKTKAQKM